MKEFKLPFCWDYLSRGSDDSEEDIEYDEAAEDNDTAYDIAFLQLLGEV